VTLTAVPIPVDVAQTGIVTSVSVTAQQRVIAGQKVGTVDVTGTDKNGDPKVTKVTLTAPSAGTVIDQPAPVGTTLQPGDPFLQLYDSAQVIFVTAVKLKDLPELAPTMEARLKAEGLNRTVRAKVARIVPKANSTDNVILTITNIITNNTNNDTEATDWMPVVLTPAGADEVRGLVPGMRFTGYVNTDSGTPGSGRLVS